LQDDLRLTPVSYIVLGLIELAGGEATPYELKRLVPQTVGHFWSVQHAQLYSEPERLAGAGLLEEEREEGGRRRRIYRLTATGSEALERWRSQPSDQLVELRAPGVLQLFFGADPAELAPLQAEAYRRELAELEALREGDDGTGPRGPWLALEAGIRASRAAVDFWAGLERSHPRGPQR
jgi:PadR family transcriptional regulator, regulatory protein AphA